MYSLNGQQEKKSKHKQEFFINEQNLTKHFEHILIISIHILVDNLFRFFPRSLLDTVKIVAIVELEMPITQQRFIDIRFVFITEQFFFLSNSFDESFAFCRCRAVSTDKFYVILLIFTDRLSQWQMILSWSLARLKSIKELSHESFESWERDKER